MDADRARELLGAERQRVERELAGLGRDEGEPQDEDVDEGDQATDLYQDELDESRENDLRDQLAAVERAGGAPRRAARTVCRSRAGSRFRTSGSR